MLVNSVHCLKEFSGMTYWCVQFDFENRSNLMMNTKRFTPLTCWLNFNFRDCNNYLEGRGLENQRGGHRGKSKLERGGGGWM